MIPRLQTAVLLFCLLGTLSAAAEDVQRLDPDKAKQIAKPLVEATAKLELPFKLTLDGERGTGLQARKVVVLVVPDAKLSADALDKLDKEVLPVGVLYTTKDISLVATELTVPAEQVRTVEISVGNNTASITVLPLAVARVAGRLVLLVYTKDKKPTVVTELTESENKSDWPLDLDAHPVGNNRAALLLNVLGRYRAALQVAAPG